MSWSAQRSQGGAGRRHSWTTPQRTAADTPGSVRQQVLAAGVLRPNSGLTPFRNPAGVRVLRLDDVGRALVGLDHRDGEQLLSELLEGESQLPSASPPTR